MADTARVTSIEALREFRDALGVFTDEAKQVLQQAHADVARRVRDIGVHQYDHWDAQLKQAEERVVKAKVEIEQARWSKPEGHSLVEERKALAVAQEDREHALERLNNCVRWRRQLDRESMLFRGQLEPLRRYLEGESPRAMRRLMDMAERLEDYVRLNAPQIADREQRSGGGGRSAEPADAATPASAANPAAGSTTVTPGSPTPAQPPAHDATEVATLRASAPPAPPAGAPAASPDSIPRHVMTLHQRRGLASVASDAGGAPLDLRTTVVAAGPTRHERLLVHHRAAPAHRADSGWRVFPHPDTVDHQRSPDDDRSSESWDARSIAAADAVRHHPPLAELWRLPVGWTVITGPGGLVAVHDPAGRRRWPTLPAAHHGDAAE